MFGIGLVILLTFNSLVLFAAASWDQFLFLALFAVTQIIISNLILDVGLADIGSLLQRFFNFITLSRLRKRLVKLWQMTELLVDDNGYATPVISQLPAPQTTSTPPPLENQIVYDEQTFEDMPGNFDPMDLDDLKSIVREHQEIVVDSIELIKVRTLAPTESELSYVDSLIDHFNIDQSALIIGDFHRDRVRKNTLIDALTGKSTLTRVICRGLRENIDLIPYSGDLDTIPKFIIKHFLVSQKKKYDRIYILSPPSQMANWQEVFQTTIPEPSDVDVTEKSFTSQI